MNESLSKVILLEHPQRFDEPQVDPTSLKPTLARLSNLTLSQLWLNSQLKDKIYIGRHSLDSPGSGHVHNARFVALKTGKYDGVHFLGPVGRSDFTKSVQNIFVSAQLSPNQTELGTAQDINHTSCTQAKHQEKQNAKYHPSVATQNRFSVLNQGNF